MAWLLIAGKFPLQVLDFVFLLFYEGQDSLVALGECGVIQHQLLQDVDIVCCGGRQVVEIPLEGFDIATVLLELIVKR